jgi:hypothetical protein
VHSRGEGLYVSGSLEQEPVIDYRPFEEAFRLFLRGLSSPSTRQKSITATISVSKLRTKILNCVLVGGPEGK